MIGRSLYENPWKYRNIDSVIYNDIDVQTSRYDIIMKYLDYVEDMYKDRHGMDIGKVSCPIFYLLKGMLGSGDFRANLNYLVYYWIKSQLNIEKRRDFKNTVIEAMDIFSKDDLISV